MSVISLLTDFGLNDNFVGVMKAVILRINPYAKIVDICHKIKAQDILGAAFLLKGSFKYFPSGTVHLVVVDPAVGSRRKKILVKTKDYFFAGPDNGVLSLALKEEPPIKIVEITNDRYFLKPVSDTFHGRDVFAPVSAYVSKGEDIEKFGKPIESFKTLELPPVKVSNHELIGEIIRIDRFGNLISNVDKDTLENFISATKRGGSANLFGGKNKKFKICIKDKTIDKLSYSYAEGSYLKPLALIDSFNFLEIAINSDSAKDYLGVDKGEKITICKIGS